MANFGLFWPRLVQNEGYYAHKPRDSGGETFMGISRNNFPNWSGWQIVDAMRSTPNFPDCLKQSSSLKEKVIEFYKPTFWDAIYGDDITSQVIAEFIADWAINAGVSVPVKHLQEIVGVTVDGKMGAITLGALNNADQRALFDSLRDARLNFYNEVVAEHPNDKEFLDSWIGRTESFVFV